jgi:5-methylthioribose kinase
VVLELLHGDKHTGKVKVTDTSINVPKWQLAEEK